MERNSERRINIPSQPISPIERGSKRFGRDLNTSLFLSMTAMSSCIAGANLEDDAGKAFVFGLSAVGSGILVLSNAFRK